jgi:hypothetical protein
MWHLAHRLMNFSQVALRIIWQSNKMGLGYAAICSQMNRSVEQHQNLALPVSAVQFAVSFYSSTTRRNSLPILLGNVGLLNRRMPDMPML